MFPKAIVFLFALALAEEAITNRVKREVLEDEDDIDNGRAVDENRTAEHWTYYRYCNVCNDIHVKEFDGEKIRLKGVCQSNVLVYGWGGIVQVMIESVPMPNVPNGNKIGNLTIVYDGVTYVITMHCVVIVDGVVETLPYDDSNVVIWGYGNIVYFRIKNVYFFIIRDCSNRCVRIYVAHGAVKQLDGICGNYNNIVGDDGPIGNWMNGCV